MWILAGNPTLRVTSTIILKSKASKSLCLSGQVITHWSTSTKGSYPPVLQGGMTYSNGYITVPESGIYFIYFNLYSAVLRSPSQNYLSVYVDSVRIGLSYYYYATSTNKSHYLGMLWNVKKGSQLSVKAEGSANLRYYFGYAHACFGAWKVN